ncbi:MAG: hypothetical protein HY756_06460 [Nitrospirae bacterium]|nr:hypothetical protein [Nitrospirota bacterium]
MRYVILVLITATMLAVSGCSADNSKELFDTAQFEELQNNKEHAVQLYEEIIKKYPQSEYAKKSQERLSKLKQ